ncbi:hypothetical protein JOE26_002799 [Rhodococcus coprophilus]|uniref:Uncharacterized protein n=1 Tax=Rhodococcus coprophilus TaxID=38310 RepID=A0A2X4UET1_9NOCA|nr:hypothetical protein [Rhodococcus coprophilus]SQI38366.1 Uncharacterised protein [Rhodococcus coprophilus]
MPVDLSNREQVAAMVEQTVHLDGRPTAEYSGRLESMVHLAHREGIMPTVATRPLTPTEMSTGVHDNEERVFVDG